MSILKKIFGSQNERFLKKLDPIVEKINNFEADIKKLTDEQLIQKKNYFRDRLSKGE
ncbi:MAG: hypothetical protein KAT05_17565, partial [Spirochaetes bacterium]|nr:hypothetical protein [Spirochaetota bacterium]